MFNVGDKVDWAETDDPKDKLINISYWGPGPFQIYKTEMDGGKQFVVLACVLEGQLMVLETRLDLWIPASDPEAAKIPAHIGASVLKKV